LKAGRGKGFIGRPKEKTFQEKFLGIRDAPGHAGNSGSAKIEARDGGWRLSAKWGFRS
jgi:hypothetical protein